jgi:glycosyltransferase involved in cell wall biosynthesis
MPATLSIIIISNNQAELLESTLLSVRWANERIVLDTGSSDSSLAVAKHAQCKATVFRHWGQNPLSQLENLLHTVKTDWVLWLKADEIISDTLRHEIQAVLERDEGLSGYSLKFQYAYGGSVFPDKAPGSEIRLVRKNAWRVVPGIEPKLQVLESDKTRTLNASLQIKPFSTVSDLLESLNQVSNLSAYESIQRHGKNAAHANIGKLIMDAFWGVFLSHFFPSKQSKSDSTAAYSMLTQLLYALKPALELAKIRQLLNQT